MALAGGSESLSGGVRELSARVIDRDDYLLDHATAFDLVVPMGDATWRWRGVEVEMSGGCATIRFGGDPDVTQTQPDHQRSE